MTGGLNAQSVEGTDEQMRKDGQWSVAIVGGHTLDLSEAALPADRELRINLATLFGGAKVIVPRGTQVDIGGFVLIGGKSLEVAGDLPNGKRVRIRFHALMGGVEVVSR